MKEEILAFSKEKKNMKSEKGVTLTALAIYIMVFILIIIIMSFVSNYFYENVGQIKDSPKYVSEFNKFSMFFVADVKRNSTLISCSDTELEFADGTKYIYKNNSIYRNEVKIAQYFKSFSFKQSEYTQNSFTKTTVIVNAELGNDNNEMKRQIEFVLKYW